MQTVNITSAIKAINTLLDADLPTMLWGSPGIGKSDIVRQVADAKGYKVIDIRALLLDPVDLRGLPVIDKDGSTSWAAPSFLPTNGDKGVLFFDELNAAAPSVQAACYQLILDRKCGEYELPAGWRIIAAGNRECDRAVTSVMPSPLANRLVHIEVEATSDDWLAWAVTNNIEPELIGFMRWRPELLNTFDPKEKAKAFATPRTWHYVDRMIKAGSNEFALVAGAVGSGPAAEFVGFLEIFNTLPGIDALLADPANSKVPQSPATMYALTSVLARKASVDNIDAIMIYADRMQREYSMAFILDAIKINPALKETQAFITWGLANQNIIGGLN